MDATGSSASIIDAQAAESAIHSGSSSSCVRPSRSMVTWRTASDLFAFERTTRVVLPCQGCHRYETITSVPWAFRRALVSPLPHALVAGQGLAGTAQRGTAGPGKDHRVPDGWRSSPPLFTAGGLGSPARASHSPDTCVLSTPICVVLARACSKTAHDSSSEAVSSSR